MCNQNAHASKFSNAHAFKTRAAQHFERARVLRASGPYISLPVGKSVFYTSILSIYFHLSKWCSCNLISKIWTIKAGSRITQRSFHYVGEQAADFPKYNTVNDTKMYRCVGWDTNGNFYRRYGSCSCQSCVKCEFCGLCTKSGLIGAWESPYVQPKVNLFPSESESESEDESESTSSESTEESDSDGVRYAKIYSFWKVKYHTLSLV